MRLFVPGGAGFIGSNCWLDGLSRWLVATDRSHA
jgi:hypothetical protein